MFVYIRSTAFVMVVAQKLVLQQSKKVTAKCTEILSPPPSIQFSLITTMLYSGYNKKEYSTLNPVYSWAQNFRQGIVMKTSFGTRVSQMGLGSFVDINIFVMKYYFI